ncbi:hypothetical protein [uncultured Dokdonia sp.]|uniref:hypothetical protein n=1 Tax=uncultured Dokdonia sp. TaxID=575653 RepID=UPI002620AA15|nr:hypothetical protein [uncultured Dokdonia sp.]
MNTNKDISKNKDYKVPENYFIDFQERLQVQLEFEELIGTKKDTGFIVPKEYFERLPEKIISEVQQPTKVVSLFKTKWLYATASVAAIIILILLLKSPATITPFEDIESDTIASYLETDNYLISDYELGELLTDDELDDLSNDIQLEDVEVIEYLDITTDPYDLMTQ